MQSCRICRVSTRRSRKLAVALRLIPIDFDNKGENLGFAGGNKVGLRYAISRYDADFFWLLNNDTVVETDALTHFMARIQFQSQLEYVVRYSIIL
jgi:GT2 family glycosyltransferase